MPNPAGIRFERLDHAHEPVRRAIFDYLAPCEAHALFILGNLNGGLAQQNLYAAIRDGRWAGLAGYYGIPHSLIPFSREPEVTRALVQHVARIHGDIHYMNGIAYTARPALAELRRLGYCALNDPEQVFMELEMPEGWTLPAYAGEESARFARDGDEAQVAGLMRIVRGDESGLPITEGEIERVRMTRLRVVVDLGGRLVSTACTNGIGIRAFQILGVGTLADCRRRGYARSACAALMRHMHQRGARHAVIFTDVNNVAARACYEGMGFRVTGEYLVTRLGRG